MFLRNGEMNLSGRNPPSFYGKQSAAYMIYWKDILVDMERMLDAAAGAATLLQKLFVRV